MCFPFHRVLLLAVCGACSCINCKVCSYAICKLCSCIFVNYIAYLQGLSAGETSDDEFCEQLYNSYLNSTDKGDAVSFEKPAETCGVNPNEL